MASESTPLMGSPTPRRPPGSESSKPPRTVTFNPTVSTSSPPPASNLKPSSQFPPPATGPPPVAGQPVLSALNAKLRRRHSQGAPLIPQNLYANAPKIGPQRTTKTAQKLKLLPDPDHGEDGPDEESGRDVYSQYTRIKDPTARRDAARLGKEDRERLPRVTAYCTASSYDMDGIMKFFKGKMKTRGAAPKLFDECIYSPYNYGKDAAEKLPQRTMASYGGVQQERRFSDSAVEAEHNNERREDLIDMHTPEGNMRLDSPSRVLSPVQLNEGETLSRTGTHVNTVDFDTEVHTPEVFLFDYGTAVIWGMTVAQEARFLKEISKFETEKLAKDNVQTEDFNFYYTREYQARIYNDFISLRDKKNYMTKLAISHALSQSVKTSLYEDLVDNTIETTKEIPTQIATTGKVNLTRSQINMQIGELFILRINIHLQGSVLDAPELMWAEPQLDPIYQAVRSYLEMDQRVNLLMERLTVIADLLSVLKDQLTHTHGEYLEWIVIVLIAAEVLVAAVNIVVDLYAGVD
ncbi:Sad1-interacting factor 2 [Aulographum hederae CBS 113979]|uniref:Sad1-interacting factor 2 n=1 Tax=Aulographum hederae CBS 113979 TaxID=1176131 RepID=A0A6G1H491_9PEZI|nr:Sad1-interacting factor 2 [Aulographum hederae CBS 113979]